MSPLGPVSEVHGVVFSKKNKEQRNVWWRYSMVWEKEIPLQTHAEASLPPEVPATHQYSVEWSLFRA